MRGLRRSYTSSKKRLVSALIACIVGLTILVLLGFSSSLIDVSVTVRHPPPNNRVIPHNPPLLDNDDKASEKATAAQVAPTTSEEEPTSASSSSALPAKLHVFTVQTGTAVNWCRMLTSAFLSGYPPIHTIAWSKKYAHSKRPRWILSHMDALEKQGELKPHDVVMFLDGADTLFTGVSPYDVMKSVDALQTQLLEYDNEKRATTKWDSKRDFVVFNAEANCFHQQAFRGVWGVKKGQCIAAYKLHEMTSKNYDNKAAFTERSSPYRYLNGGVWIGTVSAVRAVFTEAAKILGASSSLWCDQSVLGTIYLSGKFQNFMFLDKLNRFFLPTYHLRVQRDLCPSNSTDSDDANDGRKLPRMRLCHGPGFVPAVLHFNGRSEGYFTRSMLQRTSWWDEIQEGFSSSSSSAASSSQEHHTVKDVLRVSAGGKEEKRRSFHVRLEGKGGLRSVDELCTAIGF